MNNLNKQQQQVALIKSVNACNMSLWSLCSFTTCASSKGYFQQSGLCDEYLRKPFCVGILETSENRSNEVRLHDQMTETIAKSNI